MFILNRRALIKGAATASIATAATPAMAFRTTITETQREKLFEWRRKMTAVIEDLETSEGWETSAIVAGKAHAAGEIRKALGMEVPASTARDDYHEFTAEAHARYAETRHNMPGLS